ncbi:MAG: hypothetical protein OXH84_05335 [Gammaproteobacteria bacterium]|nr:hypothetical protein [Gammaproteobacteria bacterium]
MDLRVVGVFLSIAFPIKLTYPRGFRTAHFPVLDDVAANDPLSTRIVESYKHFQHDVRHWSAISEEAYFEARK